MNYPSISVLSWAALVMLLAGALPMQAAAPPRVGRITRTILATSLVRTHKDAGRALLVYTPPGYDDSDNQDKRYPVIYLLHGSPGHQEDFLRYGAWPSLMETMAGQQSAEMTLPILVMPDGNSIGEKHGDSEWADSADGRDRFETWLVHEIVPWVDSHYRTQADVQSRFIGGVSEGGFGCVNLALRHPAVFGGALACSGYYANDGSGWARPIMGYAPAFLRANSPLDYVGDAIHAKDIPTGWKTLHIFLGAGADEKRYLTETRRMAALLQTANVPVSLQVLGGKHGWGLWNQLFMAGLTYLLPGQAAPPHPAAAAPGA